MKFFSVSLLAGSALLAHAQYAGSAPIPAQYKKGVDAIKIEDARRYLTYLSTECEGRGTGQPGFFKAAEYIAARFKEAGLKPVGDKGTYFQNVPFTHYGVDVSQSFLSTEDGSAKVIGEKSISFGPLGQNADKTTPVVFVRSNGADAKLDNADILNGKIVIVSTNADTPALRSQIRQAATAAVVFVKDQVAPGAGTIRRANGSLGGITITRAAAERLCKALSLEVDTLDPMKTKAGSAEVIDGKANLHLMVKAQEGPLGVPNVVGLLEGSDPKLKAELVGVGAHLDHLGKTGDVVYPGADDDGSGSTAVLEIVHAMKVSGVKPKRSIIFMTFCGEEMGLLGSGYYSDHPIFPHDHMVAELQMDMVGRDSDGVQNGDPKRVDKKEENIDTMRLVGSKRISMDLDKTIEEINKSIGFKFKWDAEDVYTRSDHYNFAKHDIPIAFLFDGFHPDYHRPTDTVDKIDFAKLTNAAKLYYMVALEIANRADRPKHDVSGGQ
jgi:hypothetical protein